MFLSKVHLPVKGIHLVHASLGPRSCPHSNRISIGLSVFAALRIVTNMQTVATNHATPPVAVAMLCMRCGLIVMPFWFRGAFENS